MKIYSNGNMIEAGGGGVTMEQVDEAIDAKLDAYTPLDVYSTEEQRIGTWIDGKPLYRKFYVRGQTSGSAISLESNTVIDVITGFGGYVTNSKYITAIPYAAGVDGVAIDYAARNLYLILSDIYTTVNSITLYVEYTKTTDQATIEPSAVALAAVQADVPMMSVSVSGDIAQAHDVFSSDEEA